MPRCVFLVPLLYGEPQFPGVSYLFGDKPDVPVPGYGYTVGCATPGKTEPQFVTVWLNTSQANINILKARPECVWLTDLDDDGQWVSAAIPPTTASQMAVKVRDSLKYNSAKYEKAITAIQAARTSMDAAEAVTMKLFNMTAEQIAGTFGAHPPKAEKEPVIVKTVDEVAAGLGMSPELTEQYRAIIERGNALVKELNESADDEQVSRLGKCANCGWIVYGVGRCPRCDAPIPATLVKPKRLRKAKK
jgi:rubrerythrin